MLVCLFGPPVHASRGEDVGAQRDRDVHVWAVDRWLRGRRVLDVMTGHAKVADVERPWLLRNAMSNVTVTAS